MASNNNDKILAFAAVLCGLALLALAASLLVAVVSVGAQLLTGWLLLTLQITLAGSLVAAAGAAITTAGRKAVDELGTLARQHAAKLAALKKRTPTLIAATALVAQAVTAAADKAFEGNTPATIAITLVLILWFFTANELLTRLPSQMRVLGYAFWVLGVLALPFFIWVYRDFNTALVLADFVKLSLGQQALFGICFVLFLVVPFLVDF